MCGIIGYAGFDRAQDIIIGGLHALEYRGYDSAGMTVFTENGLKTVKTKGRVDELAEKAQAALSVFSGCGIGHTRWATHGKPSETNAHPHGTDTVMLVHNGIIENYKELRHSLAEAGYSFSSETDTEVAAKLLDREYAKEANPLTAIRNTISQLTGSYALGIVFREEPGVIYAVKKDSPLLIGQSENGNFIASDISAFLDYTRRYIRPEDGEIVRITKDTVAVYDQNGLETEKNLETASWNSTAAKKSGFRHFMLKEIFEEPAVLKETFDSLTKNGVPDFSETIPNDEFFQDIERIHIIACGTAMHAGLLGKFYLEKLTRIPVNVEIASEFRYNDPILSEKDLVIIISQSGETADSLAALRLVNKKNIRTLSIVNTYGSTIARESDCVIYTKAGPEIAVASTKAFSVQVLVMLLLAVKTGAVNGKLSSEEEKAICGKVTQAISQQLHEVLNDSEAIEKAAKSIAGHPNVFFIGRGIDSSLSMEASLKLKEISYIHSEAYAAGELKHGTISLIEEGTPVIALVTDEAFYEKMRSNIEEVRSRGAFVLSLCPKDAALIQDVSDKVIRLPSGDKLLRPFTAAAAIQLLAYHTALAMGRDIDKPRNLAKSVTVE